MKHGCRVLLIATLWASIAGAAPGPGPGEPFGGDDAGCVPPTNTQLGCSMAAARAYERLEKSVVKCHRRQAKARYDAVIGGRPVSFDDEACEAQAVARFDATMAQLSSGSCASSPIVATAATDGAALLAGLDAQNGGPYCDATSATPIEPGGEAGFVPASDDVRRCADKVTKNLRNLSTKVWKCHRKAGDRGFALADPAFDEEECELAALAKFSTAGARLAGSGNCPACLDGAGQDALGAALVARLDASNASAFPCPDPALHLGAALLDRPTLMALGVQLLVSGDADYDASVTVRYRAVGAPSWTAALPLFRVRPETVPGRAVAEQFAGSIFDLRLATSYEIELHAVDPDGPVDQTLTLTATTRPVPTDPVSPHIVPVSTASQLHAALAAAQPGDVIEVADGVYGGPFVLDASGTAANPIVLRGASRDGAILDGAACECNVLEVYGSFVHVERLTLRNANRALRFQTAGAEGNVVRRVHTHDTRLGFGTRDDQLDFYLCDNLLEGPLTWPHVYFDDDGAYSDVDGILVQGHGHVVCHNQVVGFGDALKTAQEGARALDFYGNEVLSAYDNGIELDEGEGNLRCVRNRFTNNFLPISFQPIYGGPAYALRNVAVNNAHEQLKFHGLGGASGPSGVLVYHNTFVSPATALLLVTSAASHHFEIADNLFVGPALPPGRVADWIGPIDHGRFDFNGYFPDGVFRFNLPPAGLVSSPSFAALQATGMETSGVLLAQPIFANGLVPPPDYTSTLTPADVTLDPTSAAVDAGLALPNVNDAFTGAAPDLGALERGCPQPIFGIRPIGIDESNEPLGCAP